MPSTQTRRCEDGGMMRKSWSSRSCLKKWTECEASPRPSCMICSLIIFYVGSDGYSVNWRRCGIVSLLVFDKFLTSYPNHWTRPICVCSVKYPQANQAHAHRMLQCLLVAVRPLRVDELSELLAFEFNVAQGGIPKYRSAWRLDDQTQAVLSTCSSLVTIIDVPTCTVTVRLYSFHISPSRSFWRQIASSPPLSRDFSRYQIRPASAHTILTQACLGSLLHLDRSR
jgi:hypothetical protein